MRTAWRNARTQGGSLEDNEDEKGSARLALRGPTTRTAESIASRISPGQVEGYF